MLALAILLYSSDNKSIESLNLAKNALKSNPQYILKSIKQNNYGEKNYKNQHNFYLKTKKWKK